MAEIELHLRLSSDGHLAVIHDPTLERTGSGDKPGPPRVVSETSLAELSLDPPMG